MIDPSYNCPSYACRNFYYTTNGEKYVMGYIDAYLVNNNTIELQIVGLQDNDYYVDVGGQATVVVDYPKDVPIYDIIMTIFDKLTEDHQYKLRYINYKDVIICSKELKKKYPEKCSTDRSETYVGAEWMPFTRETVRYLDYDEKYFILDDYDGSFIVLYGKVEYNQENQLEFTYDDPIISRDMSKEYYDITRNRIVCDVQQDPKTMKYYVKPYCFDNINEES